MVASQVFGSKRGLAIILSLLFWISSSVVLSAPVGFTTGDLEKRKPSFPSLEDCQNKFTAPAANTAMYFTGLKTRKDINAAKKYATDHGLVHVGLSYPTSFTDPGQYEGTDAEKTSFQKAFSQIYAEETSGIAYLYIDDDKSPAADSIFQSVEFPAMRDGAKVTKILRFPKTSDDPTGSTNEYWPDDQGAAELDNEEGPGASKRFWPAGDE